MLHFLNFASPDGAARLDLQGRLAELGRASATIAPLRHLSVSRHHAELIRDSEEVGWSVRNLTTNNILTVNGAQVGDAPVLLKPGDILQLGEARATYCLDAEATIPGSLPRLADFASTQFRPTAEFSERLERAEIAIVEVEHRLQENEALDKSARKTMDWVAHELHGSGERFDALAKQIQSSLGLAFGAVAISLLTATAVGIVRDTTKTNDFLRAIYEQVGSPEGAAQLIVMGGSAFIAWQRRDTKGPSASIFPTTDSDMETADYAQAPSATRQSEPSRYPVSRPSVSDFAERGDRRGG